MREIHFVNSNVFYKHKDLNHHDKHKSNLIHLIYFSLRQTQAGIHLYKVNDIIIL